MAQSLSYHRAVLSKPLISSGPSELAAVCVKINIKEKPWLDIWHKSSSRDEFSFFSVQKNVWFSTHK